jgi:hypothetical protein
MTTKMEDETASFGHLARAKHIIYIKEKWCRWDGGSVVPRPEPCWDI